MNISSIYKKDTRVTWKNVSLIMLLFSFNLLILFYYIIKLYLSLSDAVLELSIDYQAFPDILKGVLFVNYLAILFVSPIISSSLVSKEYEKNTLDLIISTNISYLDFILAKLFYAIKTVVMILIGILPIIALSFVFGGYSLIDLSKIVISYIFSLSLIVSFGIYSSCLLKRTKIALLITYIFLFFYLLIIVFISPLNIFYQGIHEINTYRDLFSEIILSNERNLGFESLEYKFLIASLFHIFFSFVLIVFSVHRMKSRK